jgi:putative transposase
VKLDRGLLLVDDSTLDKPSARAMDLVSYHWSGNHHRVVKGISLQSLIWTDGDSIIPVDARVVNKSEGKTKNDLFIELVEGAFQKGFRVEYVCFDSWYSSLENLKFLRDNEQHWLGRFKSNRLVNPDRSGNRPISKIEGAEQGRVVHLKGYGMVKIFKTVSRNGDEEFWATSDLKMNELKQLSVSEKSWGIEKYHRELKQACGIEKCQCRKARAQKNHIFLSIRAFLRLERYCFKSGVGWLEAKWQIVRDATRAYLRNPFYNHAIYATA